MPVRGDQGFPVRLRFSKRGKVRFISHRDVARAFERAFRVEQLPLAFTAGFVPRPKVSFGLALSVGNESDAEYLDVTAVEYQVGVRGADPDEVAGAVQEALASPTLETSRNRKGREVVEDVRPVIREMREHAAGTDDGGTAREMAVVDLELTTQPRGARPTEVLAAVGEHLTAERVLRTHQWIERGGARLEPLEADARMRVPEARAS